MLATQTYNQRVESGKKVEQQIIDQIRQKGHRIDPPKSHQDKSDKIDAWFHDKSGKVYPTQIKFRESGDDILFEIIKNWDRGEMGRDLKGKSVLYLVADRNGLTRLFDVAPFKAKAKEILDIVDNDANNDQWKKDDWIARIQQDRASGETKLIAYFNPNKFKPLFTWQLNLHESFVRESIKKEVFAILNEIFSG